MAPRMREDWDKLTARELSVIAFMAEGLSYDDIAREMSLSEHTIKYYKRNIYVKLNAKNGTHAVVNAHRAGIINLDTFDRHQEIVHSLEQAMRTLQKAKELII